MKKTGIKKKMQDGGSNKIFSGANPSTTTSTITPKAKKASSGVGKASMKKGGSVKKK